MSIGVAVPAKNVRPIMVAKAGGFDLAVIVPTFNEADNVAKIVAGLDAALAGIRYEILFVDDWSQDGTAERIAALASGRADIRVVRRFGRRGLSSAVIEGMMATMAPVVAVIDGDGQHDERLLPRLFALVNGGAADVAIGSRYCENGSTGDWDSFRLKCSRAATKLSQLVLQAPVTDPMSGFFAVRRTKVEALLPRLSGRGFKILFDLLTSSPQPLRVVELPFRFRTRVAGDSKLGAGVAIDYAVTIADRLIRRFAPPRPVMFAAVGTLGLGVHVAVLRGMMAFDGASFARAQIMAVLVAIAFNFLFNNSLTFRDRRLTGLRMVAGLASFYLLCGIGALANVGTGVVLFSEHHRWWVSGVAGAVIGSVWNFGASALVTWRKR
ncbi:glycosyltransferase family 2 protein [Sphingomonas abietis]|uniref:Glycosyltransferase family 2 protein n=1 Tax=Sphingomonas abietis TaxID=3012344 RepID=A0ABY7NMN1_9SPHN|nr:glycosyltransferase family 2 protein [Sphingomonas abietis]WBO22782.1 glycosyltransferase family 2 protein [Sphingomonas abietis]